MSTMQTCMFQKCRNHQLQAETCDAPEVTTNEIRFVLENLK